MIENELNHKTHCFRQLAILNFQLEKQQNHPTEVGIMPEKDQDCQAVLSLVSSMAAKDKECSKSCLHKWFSRISGDLHLIKPEPTTVQ